MKLVADLQLHSKYSRAVSQQMVLENLDKWAKIKGINVLGTGDLTHPLWLKEIKQKLEPAEPGLFKLKKEYKVDSFGRLDNETEPRFMLTGEISCIYSKGGKVRRVHHLYLVPDIATAEKINAKLSFIGNLKSDGRPILGLDSKKFLEICLEASPDVMVIPAHAWTPWFSIFGSKSGFDSIEECFEDLSKYIYAVETGLSSDPAMNWRLSKLDNVALVSNSDSHSPTRIGREANVFDTELDYYKIIEAIKSKDPKKFLFTVEFFPEEGKYHYDGHRLCSVSFGPEETKKYNFLCPKCRRPLTVGVLARVAELADRPEGFRPASRVPYKNVIPLDQIISDSMGLSVTSNTGWPKRVLQEYEKLIKNFGNEFNVLLDVSSDDLNKLTLPEIAEGVAKVREGLVHIEPGYDGEYGKIRIFTADERENASKQASLL
ncbi:MAG: DNA helicase UvrD [Parcubacteria group bacterium]|nr:DNA helicase UvrD [Parcubacteria group bacterium]